MREIKYRALANNGIWYYSDDEAYILRSKKNVLYLMELENLYNNKDIELSFIGEAYQYTGLKDKNGVEIYEGDIVKIPEYIGYHEDIPTGTNNYIIEYVMCCYGISTTRGFKILADYATSINDGTSAKCEVIGNIYENKELLDEK